MDLSGLGLEKIDGTINGTIPDANFTFSQIVTDAVTGKLNLSPDSILNNGFAILIKEIQLNSGLIRNLIIISIISALLRNLTDSFKNKSTGELGFYVTYIVLVITLVQSFGLATGIMVSLIQNLSNLMVSTMPLMMSLIIMSGSVSSAYVFNPLMYFAIEGITIFITHILLPIITTGSILSIINYISEKESLNKLTQFIKRFIDLSLKGVAVLFLTVLSLEKISAPIVNNFVVKSAKVSVSSIPVVGEIITGAMDTVLFWAQGAKSGVMVAIIVSIIIMCAVPIIKVFTMVLIYKITAALIEPISDARIVKCIDTIGNYTTLIMWSGLIVSVMFVFSVIIMLSF